MFGSKKNYLIVFVVNVLLIVATSQTYASEIASVTGQFSHDSTNVIINGSGFGQKIPAEPYFYDNFESGVNGDYLVGKEGTVGSTTWLEYMRRGSPQYSDNSSYGKGTLAAHKTSSGNDFMTAGIDGLLSNDAYLSYNYKWTATSDNWEKAVYKLSRITSQGGLYSETPSVFPQYQPKHGWAYDGYNPGEGGPGNFSFTAPEQDTWHRAEVYMKLSDPAGSTNGEVQTRYNNVANIDEQNVLTRTASKSDKLLDSFILPFQIANNSANTYSIWADDVYFDTTRARVEICDTPTWQSRTHCDIQIPTSWSDDGTSVGITVNQGEFSSEETAYLYVIDSNGIVSNDGNGHPVTITDTYTNNLNLIYNSSFELGKTGFEIISSNPLEHEDGADNLIVELDETTRQHGNASLKITHSKTSFFKLIGQSVKLTPGKEYFASLWMKSSNENYPVRIIIQSVATGSKWDSHVRQFSLGTEWKRFGFAFQVPEDGLHTDFTLRLETELDVQGQDPENFYIAGSVWVDGVQLSEGGQKDYQPRTNIESAIILDKEIPLYEPGEAINGQLKIIAYTGEPTDTTFIYQVIDDYYKKTVLNEELDTRTMPGQVVQHPIQISDLKRGGYAIAGEVAMPDDAWSAAYTQYLAVTESAESTTMVNEDAFSLGINTFTYGVQYMGSPSTQPILVKRDGAVDPFEWYAMQGIRWVRDWCGRTAFLWRDIQPEPNEWNWEASDYLVESAAKHNIRVLPVLGGSSFMDDKIVTHWRPEAFPDWVLERAEITPSPIPSKAEKGITQVLPRMEDWEKFIGAIVTRYKGKITHYEIMNEPNLYLLPDTYVKYLKSAYEVAKRIDPDCKIVGFCSTGDQAKLIPFLQACFDSKLGGLQYCDIVSFHPYHARLSGSEVSAQNLLHEIRTLVDEHGGKGKPIWNTELYYMNTEVGHGHEASIIKGNEIARRFLIDLGEDVQQSMPLAYLFNTRPTVFEKRHQHYPTAMIPSFRYVIYAQLARYFEGATPVKRIDWTNPDICYVMKKEGRLIAALWNYDTIAGRKLHINLPPSQVEILDMFGNTVDSGGSEGITLDIGNEPVYIIWTGSDQNLFLERLSNAGDAITPSAPSKLEVSVE